MRHLRVVSPNGPFADASKCFDRNRVGQVGENAGFSRCYGSPSVKAFHPFAKFPTIVDADQNQSLAIKNNETSNMPNDKTGGLGSNGQLGIHLLFEYRMDPFHLHWFSAATNEAVQ